MSKKSINKEKIIETATIIFAKKGYRESSMQSIADELGVTKASLYYHFKNKDEILFSLIKKFSEKFEKELNKGLDNEKDDERKLEIIINYLVRARENFPEINLFRTLSFLGEDKNKVLKKARLHRERLFEFINEKISELSLFKGVSEIDVRLVTLVVMGIMFSSFVSTKFKYKEITQHLIKLLKSFKKS